MEWQTKITPDSNGLSISHADKILSLGSCFAENMGQYFLRYGFSSQINPFGILFNPVSIANSLFRVLRNEEIREPDLIFHDGLWHSHLHHGSFSQENKEDCLKACNDAITSSHSFLKQTDILVLTFGTSFVYHTREGVAVANCHKIPATEFTKHLYNVDEIVSLYETLIPALRAHNPKLKILFTVSPVRHWKDGYRENQLSKSILHLAVDKLQSLFSFVYYFPSYEIVIDELRDYRFYAEDMLHLTKTTVDYIWKQFSETYFSSETRAIISDVEKFRKMEEHRPLNRNSEQEHCLKVTTKRELLLKTYPFLELQ